MKFKINTALIFFVLIFGISRCGKGIEPEPPANPDSEIPGLSGTVYFKGGWNPEIKWTILILFKNALRDSTDFNIGNFIYISNPIPFGIEKFEYNTLKDSSVINAVAPGSYAYMAVAQSTLEQISLVRSDWFISGVYLNPDDSSEAGTITIPENKFLTGINITCDYQNPPPQPPE